MNLHLLDPSKLPDRIDSTLTIPRRLHPPMRKRGDESASATAAPPPVEGAPPSTIEERKIAERIPKKKGKFPFAKTIPSGTDASAPCDGEDEASRRREEAESSTDADAENPEEGATDPKGDAAAPPSTETAAAPPRPRKKKRRESKPTAAPAEDAESAAWTSCRAVSFDGSGTYLASGHASGLVPVHSFASRCLSAVYGPPASSEGGAEGEDGAIEMDSKPAAKQPDELQYARGVTSLSWDASGRYLLAGGMGDDKLRLMDNSHPVVGWDCAEAVRRVAAAASEQQSRKENASGEGEMSPAAERMRGDESLGRGQFFDVAAARDGKEMVLCLKATSFGRGRILQSRDCRANQHRSLLRVQSRRRGETHSSQRPQPTATVPCVRHSTIVLRLPAPLRGPCALHPAEDRHRVGAACMMDGSLALFCIPPLAFFETIPDEMERGSSEDDVADFERLRRWMREEEDDAAGNIVYLVPPATGGGADSSQRCEVTSASFGKNGRVIYAVTKCGTILGFDITPSTLQCLEGRMSTALMEEGSTVRPSFAVKIPGGAIALQVSVSKNGKYVLVNSADCALRLYDTDELCAEKRNAKPKFVFQDLVSKAPWCCCDFSADGEYVVGGCNSYPLPGDNYNLFIWNVVTGDLLDQLTGPQVSLNGLSCHPTRPFIAVASSDGIVDIWGPRINWIAFAPDFQALQSNILYDEREDEFDIVVDGEGKEDGEGGAADSSDTVEDQDVDILTLMKDHAFGDNSQIDENPFYFETRVLKMIPDKPSKKSSIDDA